MSDSPLLNEQPQEDDAPPRAARPGPDDASRRVLESIAEGRRREDARLGRRLGLVAIAVIVLVGSAALTLHLLPRPTPDYLNDDFGEVLDFTLLSDEFNNLPLEDRLKLIRDLIERFRTMSGEDSVAMAAFASRIKDKLRSKMEENTKRLFVDLMDFYAQGYADVPIQEQGPYIDQTLLNMTRLWEEVTGMDSGLPDDDQERLETMRRQARRDEEWMRNNRQRDMEAGRVIEFIDFLQRDASEVAEPKQRARVTKFGRDMTRRLRGQDVETGEPAARPAGG